VDPQGDPNGAGAMSYDNSTDVIVTRGLGKAYGSVTGLHGLDLRVPKGSIFGFLGPNGAGKTTTIKLLLGLTRPTSGSASVVGYDVAGDGLRIRQRIGYLAQQPQFYDHMTARQTLRFTVRLFFHGPARAADGRIDEMLELVGLADRADRPVRGFSGGERQRLGIAQAQINEPELLILDEPASALDPVGRRDVLEIMRRLRDRTTIFYSTHILDDVERVSDTVAILSGGRLAAQGSITDLLHRSTAEFTLAIHGNGDGVPARLRSRPWVSAVRVDRAGPLTTLNVVVNDDRAADTELLRLVLDDPHTTVASFGRTRQSLEDLFIELVNEGESQ
jgi:ABC-2 type transport system ATP-binding protein